MILVNERQGYRVCLECHQEFVHGDERAWLREHAACSPSPEPASAA